MPKKQSTKKRTEVKDLPKKEQKLGKGDMKKVRGADEGGWQYSFNAPKSPKPPSIK